MKRHILIAALMACISVTFQALAANPLSRYTIVYNSDAEAEEGIDMALALQAAVKTATGSELPIASDKEAGKGKQIIIGRGDLKDTFDYSIVSESDRLFLNGGGCWAMTKAVRLIQEGLTDGRSLKQLQTSGNIYAEQLFPRTEGTDLRILDDNIWQYDRDNVIPDPWKAVGVDCRDEVRYRALAEVVLAYRPDILTMQEYSSHMDKYLAPELAKYGYVNAVNGDGTRWNFTPIFYNEKTVKPVQTRYILYTPEDYSNGGTKCLTTGIFSMISSGRTFCLLNTHLWWRSESVCPGSDLARASQLRLCMAQAENLLSQAGDVPLFIIGDMNCTLHSVGLQQLVDYGYVPVQDVATVFGDRRCGHHVCGPNDGFSRETHCVGTCEDFYGAIDHFMVYSKNRQGKLFSGAEIKVFERIQAYFTIEFTDHYPNFADIKL